LSAWEESLIAAGKVEAAEMPEEAEDLPPEDAPPEQAAETASVGTEAETTDMPT
jgi:hypothetical protein